MYCFRRVRPTKYFIYCVFECAKQCSDFEGEIRKSELSTEHKQCEVLCLRRLNLEKYGMYCVFEASSELKRLKAEGEHFEGAIDCIYCDFEGSAELKWLKPEREHF